MAEPLTIEGVRHVAKLSRLAIPEQDLAPFTTKLSAILGYIEKISQADVSGVEPMAHATGLTNVLREDVVEEPLPVEKVLANAPDSDPPFFKVPKVLGGDEDSAG